ncbi:MAG: methyltransferase [Alphaproteobacteria bacterium]|nr:methyltransferase [Alphaproteobacteria bacterium]
MATLDITIDDLGAQGDGIAHVNNTTVFVAGALKGERVRVEMDDATPTNKSVVKRGSLLEVLVPNSQRATPPCPHFPQCGGCRFQHMNDSAYSEFKVDQLRFILAQAKLDVPPIMPAIVTANQTRRRARVTVEHDKDGIHIGFNEWRSHTIVDVKSCEVIKPELVDEINKLRKFLPIWLPKKSTCDIQLTSLPEGIDLVLIGGPRLEMNERQNLGYLAEHLGVAHMSWRKWDRSPIEPIAHRSPLSVKFGHTRLAFPPGSFLQATQTGEEALINFACQTEKPGMKILDLFCGLGTFGLSFESPKLVHFCDLDGPAITSLEAATKSNARHEVRLRNLNVDPFSSEECDDYDLVIFDPPRGGAKAQAQQLAKSEVRQIVAISCDPVSFARDAHILMDGGYSLEKLLPIDQFLWSPHLEVAGLFTRD